MATAITVAARPASITGIMSQWSEAYTTDTLRSQMDSQITKVRRRSTHTTLTIRCSASYPASLYANFIDWFRIAQQTCTKPTYIQRPVDFKEIVVRAVKMPDISWSNGAEVFTASMEFEQLPGWELL